MKVEMKIFEVVIHFFTEHIDGFKEKTKTHTLQTFKDLV